MHLLLWNNQGPELISGGFMAESEDYASSLNHDHTTQSYHSPVEQGSGAEEQLMVTWVVQNWPSPTSLC